LIGEHVPTVCLLQECFAADLEEFLGSIPRSSGKFFRRNNDAADDEGLAVVWCAPLELVEQRRIWFSPTPELESTGWRSAHKRIGIVTTFAVGGKELVVANVHLDHRSRLARAGSARLLASMLQRVSAAAVIVGGDFNAAVGSAACAMLDGLALDRVGDGCATLRRTTDKNGHYARMPTFLGWRGIPWTRRVIDHFFHGGALDCSGFSLQEVADGGVLLTDHRMLLASYRLHW
jgi:endonuclease/exonuclease/phosphatase family metal-dependent hydrolase